MRVTVGAYTVFDARRPEPRIVADLARQHGPALALLQCFERGLQVAGWRPDERIDARRQFPGAAAMLALHRIAQGALESSVVVNLAFEEQQRSSGTLLPAVTEGAL